MSEAPTAARLAKTYVKIRESKRDLMKEVKKLDDQLETLQRAMLEICKEQEATTIRTEFGTISRRVTKKYWTTDWPSFFKFLKDRDLFSLVQQRINNTNMEQFLDENPDLLPPGLNAEVEYTATIIKR